MTVYSCVRTTASLSSSEYSYYKQTENIVTSISCVFCIIPKLACSQRWQNGTSSRSRQQSPWFFVLPSIAFLQVASFTWLN